MFADLFRNRNHTARKTTRSIRLSVDILEGRALPAVLGASGIAVELIADGGASGRVLGDKAPDAGSPGGVLAIGSNAITAAHTVTPVSGFPGRSLAAGADVITLAHIGEEIPQ